MNFMRYCDFVLNRNIDKMIFSIFNSFFYCIRNFICFFVIKINFIFFIINYYKSWEWEFMFIFNNFCNMVNINYFFVKFVVCFIKMCMVFYFICFISIFFRYIFRIVCIFFFLNLFFSIWFSFFWCINILGFSCSWFVFYISFNCFVF